MAETSERLKSTWAADVVKAKFQVGTPKTAGAAAAPSASAPSDNWASFDLAPSASSSGGGDWAAFPSAPAPAPAPAAPAPKPAPAANLLDDLFSAAPAPATAAPAQAWGAPAPVTATIVHKPAAGADLLGDLFGAAPAPSAQVRSRAFLFSLDRLCHNHLFLILCLFL